MAKNSMKQIEKDEKKIINELSTNANKSINEIAKTCGFSRQKVWRIIKNLEKNNTIWGYVAVTNEEKLEKKSYIVLIKRTNQPLSNKLVENIVKREIDKEANLIGVDIISSLYLNGVYDWIICFDAKNIIDAKKFCENLTKKFEGYINEIQLLEKMFATKKCGIENPDVGNLKEFFTI